MKKIFFAMVAMLATSMVSVAQSYNYGSNSRRSTTTSTYGSYGTNPSTTSVSGYTRSNGTYVNGYTRTQRNDTNHDNYSTYRNYNPYNQQFYHFCVMGKFKYFFHHLNPVSFEKKS